MFMLFTFKKNTALIYVYKNCQFIATSSNYSLHPTHANSVNHKRNSAVTLLSQKSETRTFVLACRLFCAWLAPAQKFQAAHGLRLREKGKA